MYVGCMHVHIMYKQCWNIVSFQCSVDFIVKRHTYKLKFPKR